MIPIPIQYYDLYSEYSHGFYFFNDNGVDGVYYL